MCKNLKSRIIEDIIIINKNLKGSSSNQMISQL